MQWANEEHLDRLLVQAGVFEAVPLTTVYIAAFHVENVALSFSATIPAVKFCIVDYSEAYMRTIPAFAYSLIEVPT